MWSSKRALQTLRVAGKRALGVEPNVRVRVRPPLEFHGGAGAGWCIVENSLHANAVVVDIGLGEDVSFSESIIKKYQCVVNGFDPTPRAIQYVTGLANPRLKLFEYGLGVTPGTAEFFLPNITEHVSGAITRERHLGQQRMEVALVTLGQVFSLLACDRIDVLKLDIEGTEFDVIHSPEFHRYAPAIGQICVEFHHRWEGRGKQSTVDAVATLERLGFACAWYSRTTNEEFLFTGLEYAPTRP